VIAARDLYCCCHSAKHCAFAARAFRSQPSHTWERSRPKFVAILQCMRQADDSNRLLCQFSTRHSRPYTDSSVQLIWACEHTLSLPRSGAAVLFKLVSLFDSAPAVAEELPRFSSSFCKHVTIRRSHLGGAVRESVAGPFLTAYRCEKSCKK